MQIQALYNNTTIGIQKRSGLNERNRRNQKAGCETSEKTREEKFDSPDKIVYKIQ